MYIYIYIHLIYIHSALHTYMHRFHDEVYVNNLVFFIGGLEEAGFFAQLWSGWSERRPCRNVGVTTKIGRFTWLHR
jgi:hypothetical protein